jgi:hypothetical protein
MGTRGWFVFVFKGKYYIIYNHFDSYPSGLGASLLEQIFDLMHKFQGDIKTACAHWTNLLSKLEYKIGYSKESEHPFNNCPGYKEIEMSMKCDKHPVQLVYPPSDGLNPKGDDIAYIWTIDLDKAIFVMQVPYNDIDQCWITTFKQIYLTLLDKTSRDDNIERWYNDIDSEIEMKTNGLVQIYSAIKIQATFRRYLAFKKALEPGSGLLYLSAKREFEKCAFAAGVKM